MRLALRPSIFLAGVLAATLLLTQLVPLPGAGSGAAEGAARRPAAHPSCPQAGKKKQRRRRRCRPAKQHRAKGPSAPAPEAKPAPASTPAPSSGSGGGVREEVSESSPPPASPAPAAEEAPAGPGASTSTVGTISNPLSEAAAEGEGPFRFFSPTSIWNREVPAAEPTDPQSGPIMGAFEAEVAREVAAKTGPWIDTTAYSVPIYRVPAGQPTVPVTLSAASPSLGAAFRAVPLPPEALPAKGTDGHLVVWQPSTERLWEFWRLVKGPGGWSASWGGTMEHVQQSGGVYGPSSYPGATRWWGASASSLSIAGGLITLEDLEAGVINHALAISVPNVRAGVFAFPAQRTDGSSLSPTSLPEGAHLRLDPKLDLAALHLPRLTLMIAEAAQRYGIIVRDGSPSVASFYAQDSTPTGSDPYHGPGGFLEGKYPSQLLASFPWSHLELLEMELEEGS
jgi:hypothetical protein